MPGTFGEGTFGEGGFGGPSIAEQLTSAAAQRIYERLRPYWKGEGDDSDWVLLHLCEAAVQTVARAEEALRYDDEGSGWRRLLDPDRCPWWALDWLRQLVGLDRFPTDFTDDQKRDQIKDSPRFKRGTRQMIRAAAGLHLIGTKTVVFTERHGGSRHYQTAVFADEAPDQQRVIDELKKQKPATFIWQHVFIGADGWADVDVTHTGWTEVLGDFTGWNHVMTDPTHT